jgi:hypothetical protein
MTETETETVEIPDAEAFTRSLTGFDEVAIKRMFAAPLGELDGGLIPRALLFIADRRTGANDADAFRRVMELPLGDVEARFGTVTDPGKAPTTSTTGGPTSS